MNPPPRIPQPRPMGRRDRLGEVYGGVVILGYVALLVFLLAGCSSLPSVDTVRVPIPVPCAAEVPARPATATDSDLLGMDDRAFVLAIARDRERLLAHVETLEAVLAACR